MPVEEFISTKSPKTKAKVAHLINLPEIHGNILGTPHSKQLMKGKNTRWEQDLLFNFNNSLK